MVGALINKFMRKLIDIISEDATTAGDLISPASATSKWGKEPEADSSPEGEALTELKAAAEKYMSVMQNSQHPSANQHLTMMKKIKSILQWMSTK